MSAPPDTGVTFRHCTFTPKGTEMRSPEEQQVAMSCLHLAADLARLNGAGASTEAIVRDAKALEAFVTGSSTEREETDAR